MTRFLEWPVFIASLLKHPKIYFLKIGDENDPATMYPTKKSRIIDGALVFAQNQKFQKWLIVHDPEKFYTHEEKFQFL